MYLKRLQLTGFKTFADKTEIEFAPGVTAIVGPNGSGKSNIADALLWVLGEQRATAVRGSRAQDVIFSGSAKRKGLGVCEVSLTVDNTDQFLPLAFEEVTITRRAYKSGEGEYLINKTPCRLRDIYELFLDTGVGRESYALVNQSEVDAVLSADPETRRGLFEEAAGIKKYRVKKREALKKLEATEANLTRIRDILTEIEDQIGPLGEQAELAIRYNGLKDSLSRVEQDHLIVEMRTADGEREAARRQRVEHEAVAAEAQALLTAAEDRSALLAVELDAAELALEAARGTAQGTLSALERAESEMRLAAERSQGLTAQIGLLERELEDIDDALSAARQQLSVQESQAAEARSEEGERRRSLGGIEMSAKDLSDRIHALQRALEQRRARAAQIVARQATRQAELARAEARFAEAENSLPALREEVRRLAARMEELAAAEATAREQAAELQTAVDAADAAMRSTDADLDSAREAERAAQGRWDAARGRTVSLGSRLKSLSDLEAAKEGYLDGVRAVVRAARSGDLPIAPPTVVADAFTARADLAIALEAALGDSLQDVIVETQTDAIAAIDYLTRRNAGRATFRPLVQSESSSARIPSLPVQIPPMQAPPVHSPVGDGPPMQTPAEAGDAANRDGLTGACLTGAALAGADMALDLIEFDEKFRPVIETLLGGVIVCDTLGDALAIAGEAAGFTRIAARTGEIVHATGAITGGPPARKGASLLGRKSEIAQVERDLALQTAEETAGQIALEEAREAIGLAQGAQQAKRQAREQARLELAQRRMNADQAVKERARVAGERDGVVRRIEGGEVAIAQFRQSVAEISAAVAELSAESAGAQEGAEVNQSELRDLLAEQESLRAASTTERIALATISERAGSLERAAKVARADAERAESQIRRRREQESAARAELGSLAERSAQRAGACEIARLAAEAAHANLAAAQTVRHDLSSLAHVAAGEARTLRTALSTALDGARKHELREQRYELQAMQTAQRLLEEYDVTAQFALSLESDPEVPRDTPREVARMRRELRAMGEVNTGAADEFQRLCQRREFLTEQKADSETARERILEAIREIDEGTRGVFMESFTAVGVAFEALFVRLFGGGGTELVLTRPDDLLETGVEINVQLPGKKRQNLLLLSGGERALTATALLFAFLKVKPAPFCVLDEVDAPLDGVNVERFADLLRDFADQTQFLVITHNPSTMEAAPIWYGVTMSEPGVSRILSLEVPRIVE